MKLFKIFSTGIIALCLPFLITAKEAAQLPYTIKNLSLSGDAEKDNAKFSLRFKVVTESAVEIEILSGAVSEISSEVKGGGGFLFFSGNDAKTQYSDNAYILSCSGPGEYEVRFDFSAKVTKSGSTKSCSFALQPALCREMTMKIDSGDVELKVNGALNIKKDPKAQTDKSTLFTALLPPSGDFTAEWKSHIEKIDAELVCSVGSGNTYNVLPGSVKLYSSMYYQVIQGKLSSMDIAISPDLNVLNVKGDNIQDWHIKKTSDKNILSVTLSREYEKSYDLELEAEKILPDFPCEFSIPSAVPEKVLKFDGRITFGTDRAVKLIIVNTQGLNQIDNAAPARKGTPAKQLSLFTYTFSGSNYALKAKAENISPSCSAEMTYILNVKDEDLQVSAQCMLDIKDAPLKELIIKYDSTLMLNRVEGPCALTNDYEISGSGKFKTLKIPFRPDTMGSTTVNIFFEKSFRNQETLGIPQFTLESAKSVRGYMLLAASKGLVINAEEMKELRQVYTGSAPIQYPGLQLVYRLKNQDWQGTLKIKHETPSVVSEVFDLLSIGEGSVYGSSLFSYHISGAPLKKFVYSVDKSIRNLEFSGKDILDWKKIKDNGNGKEIWELNLREKIFGDVNFLATYEIPLQSADAKLTTSPIETENAVSENAFIAVSSARNLKIAAAENQNAENVQSIDISEIPEGYRALINNPLLKAFKSLKKPHGIEVAVSAYPEEKLLDTVVDHSEISTRIDRNGAVVSQADYRIKNSSSQFLSLKLPENSKLWDVSVNGERKRISSADNKLLIPLPRLQDINIPIAVSVTYAEQFAALGNSAKLKLRAPVLDAESMLLHWTLRIPENYKFSSYDGNLNAVDAIPPSGLPGMLSRILKQAPKWFKGNYLISLLFFTLAGLILVFAYKDGKLSVGSAFLTILFLLISLGAGVSTSLTRQRFEKEIPSFLTNKMELTKLFSLPGDSAFIDIKLSDMSAFSIGNIVSTAGFIILAIALFLMAQKLNKAIIKAFFRGLGTAFVLAAFAQWIFFNAVFGFFAGLLLPFLIVLLALTVIFRRRKFAAAAVSALLFCAFPGQAADTQIQIKKADFDIFVMEKGIAVNAHYEINADSASEIKLIGKPAVLSGKLPDVSGISIVRKNSDFYLKVDSSGTYSFDTAFQLPFKKTDGNILFQLPIPACSVNNVKVRTDRENMMISSDSAISMTTEFKNKLCTAIASFKPGTIANFTLSPQARDVEKEKVSFFANVDEAVKFSGGFVEIRFMADLQIAQGECSKFKISIPGNMRVTAVETQDLGAWKYQQDKNLLEILLTQPHHGQLRININAQITGLNMPYNTKISCIKIEDAVRQHGAIGLFAAPGIQIQDLTNEGLNRINNSDFPACPESKDSSLKKTFRYFNTAASVSVQSIEIEPEIRVLEKTRLDFGDERTLLESIISIDAAKSGIFSAEIEIPSGFEIDAIKGKDIQHWDEINTKEGRKVIVNFTKKILGTTALSVRLSKMGKMDSGTVAIPDIRVRNAKRLNGELAIAIEKGTKLEVIERDGIETSNENFDKYSGASVHKFLMHRPDWKLKVLFDITAPWVQLDNLQKIKIADDAIECEGYFNYQIENAGLKRFHVQLPAGAEAAEFSGRDIANSVDTGKNIWEIELHRKTGKDYRLKFRFRLPAAGKEKLVITPAKALDTGMQTGYMAILGNGTEQIRLSEIKGEAVSFDPRKIPSSFRAGKLSDAVICLRTVGNDYHVEIDVLRHEIAKILKAEVESVDIQTVVSTEGRAITRLDIKIANGNETFLKTGLPPGSSVWSVFIDDQPVSLARGNKGELLIPLKQSLSGKRRQTISLVYSLKPDASWQSSRQNYIGPSFDLPLKNISWSLYLPPEFSYSGIGGTLDYKNEFLSQMLLKTMSDYDKKTQEFVSFNISTAKNLLKSGTEFAAKGRQNEAFEAFQNAMNLSGNDYALNDDIQGQWLETQRKQSVNAIVNRRNDIAGANKQSDAGQTGMKDMEQKLGGVELKNLQSISDKIFFQQRAAIAATHPLRVTIPENGKVIRFERAVQINTDAPAKVWMKATGSISWKNMPLAISIIITTIIASALFMLISLGAKKKES